MVPIGNMRELLTDERAAMEAYKREFIEFMVQSDVLKFGDFTLKSGRKSPFFMNAGAYVTGEQLHRLGLYYAQAINDNFGLDFDVVFGPAYKGIPLAVVTAMALQELYGKEVKYCCNRKEVKDHGADAGNLLGAAQSGHMISVGYDLYLKLLEEAVLEERGEPSPEESACTADLDVTANIDKAYVTSGEQRMDLYRRMAGIRSQSDADELLDEIVDRYGDPPRGVMNLIDIALLRARASAAGTVRLCRRLPRSRAVSEAHVRRAEERRACHHAPADREGGSPAGRGEVREDLSGRVEAARFAALRHAARATRDTAVCRHGTQFTVLR